MAEIVGIVAAVPALLGAIRAVSNKIGSLRTAFTESSNTLTALAEECDSTAAVLGTVHSLAAGQPDLFTGEDANISLVHTFEKAVPQCSTIIATLRKEIESYGGSSSVRERAKFALNEQKLKEILERLRGQRSSVHFVMAGLQLQISCRIHSQVASPTGGTARRGSLDSIRSVYMTRPKGTENASEKIMAAVQTKNVYELRRLLQNNVSPDSNGADTTPLHEAASLGEAKLVELLLRHGANLNAVSTRGDTSLVLALAEKHEEVANMLLDSGADYKISNSDGMSPLHLAVLMNLRSCVQKMLIRGADANETRPTAFGNVPVLSVAIKKTPPDQSIIELLLHHGANPLMLHHKRTRVETVLHQSVRILDGSDIIRTLAEAAKDFTVEDEDGRTVLHLAAQKGNEEAVRILLKAGAAADFQSQAKLDRKDPDGIPADFYALSLAILEKENLSIVKLLLDEGASPNVISFGLFPIQLAAKLGRSESIKLLLQKGARLDVETPFGSSPLQIACDHNNAKIAEMLLAAGASPDFGKGYPPLLIAATAEGSKEIIKLLLDHGGDVNIRDNEHPNFTALHAARELYIAEILLERGTEVDATTVGGTTPLHTALVRGNIGLARLLVYHGANRDKKDETGSGIIHYAAVRGSVLCVAYALGLGADVTDKCSDGSTALHIAAHQGHTDLSLWLLEMGANPLASKANGPLVRTLNDIIFDETGTPSEVARVRGFEELARTIEQYGSPNAKKKVEKWEVFPIFAGEKKGTDV